MDCRLPAGGGTIEPGAMPPLHRYLGNPVLSFIGRMFFGPSVTDFHCGLRGFSRDVYQRFALLDGFSGERSSRCRFGSQLSKR
jgi:hypothetical protein